MKPLRVGLYTWGSEGDVRPFVALAGALKRRGHAPSLGYTAIDGRDWSAACASIGVPARAIGVESATRARTSPGPHLDALVGKGNPIAQVRSVIEAFLDPLLEELWDDAQSTMLDCDVAIVHLLASPVLSTALQRGVPLVTVQPAPITVTRHMPPMGAPDLGPLNPLLWSLADRFACGFMLPRYNPYRARAGLPPMRSVLRPPPGEVALSLTCVSPTLVARPDDWEPSHEVTGFFELPASAHGFTPSPELEAFFAAGEPPVLMTFGSMLAVPGPETVECVRAMIEATEHAGCRALIQAPWAELPELSASPRVFRLGRAPHSELLARCRAMVHHGGAGTTHTACLAGRPSVVVPFLADQGFWAARLRALGVAPAPVPRKRLDGRTLGRQLRALLDDPRAPARALELSAAMQREDGVARASELIERVAAITHP